MNEMSKPVIGVSPATLARLVAVVGIDRADGLDDWCDLPGPQGSAAGRHRSLGLRLR